MSMDATQTTPKSIQSSDSLGSTTKAGQVSHLYAHLYIMFYRHGMNANLTKGFFCEGDLVAAQRRAREHCKKMNYHFIFVRPLICDLDLEEDYRMRGGMEGEMIA